MSQSATPSNSAAAGLGPAAARLADAAANPSASVGVIPRSVYDALTDLFLDHGALTPESRRPTVVPVPPDLAPKPADGNPDRGVRIEGVVLGNLPVLASAWATQYAREVAIENRSIVAMLRARSGLFTLELVGENAKHAQTPGTNLETPSHETLDRAILAALQAGTWIVCADSEALFGDYLEEGLLDGLTLLTGADEPAIVACYRNLKSLVTRPNADTERANIDPSAIRLAVMGATAQRAHDAAQRLEKAAETFLGRRPGRTVCISKIGGAAVRTLFRGSDPRSVDELIDLVRTMQPGVVQPSVVQPVFAKPELAPVSPAAIAPIPASRPPSSVRSIISTSNTPASVGPRALSANLPGLIQLPHRCPYAPEVELAVDAEGCLHLLHRAGPTAAPVIVQLLTARAWAVMHAEMLRAACPSLHVGTTSGFALGSAAATVDSPVMHAFTDHPKDVRGLLDTDVRLHLLARASVPGSEGGAADSWVCRDLN